MIRKFMCNIKKVIWNFYSAPCFALCFFCCKESQQGNLLNNLLHISPQVKVLKSRTFYNAHSSRYSFWKFRFISTTFVSVSCSCFYVCLKIKWKLKGWLLTYFPFKINVLILNVNVTTYFPIHACINRLKLLLKQFFEKMKGKFFSVSFIKNKHFKGNNSTKANSFSFRQLTW